MDENQKNNPQEDRHDELRHELSQLQPEVAQEDKAEEEAEDLTYIPARRGSAHYTVPLALFIVGFSCMILSTFMPSFRVIPQIIALVLIVAGVLLTTRFGLSMFEYSIVLDPSLGRSLVVTRLQGKYRREACRLPLTAVREVICEDDIPAERLSGAIFILQHYVRARYLDRDIRLFRLAAPAGRAGSRQGFGRAAPRGARSLHRPAHRSGRDAGGKAVRGGRRIKAILYRHQIYL